MIVCFIADAKCEKIFSIFGDEHSHELLSTIAFMNINVKHIIYFPLTIQNIFLFSLYFLEVLIYTLQCINSK